MIYPSLLTAVELKQPIGKLALLFAVKGNLTKEEQKSACLSSFFYLLFQNHALYLTPGYVFDITNLCKYTFAEMHHEHCHHNEGQNDQFLN